ncbi:MAG: prenyltransferase [Deltaproteobacteria bacterium]|nr:prenyltransferase [Deltaproteobacteria bacterium]
MEQALELNLSSKRWQVLQPAIYLISILPGLAWAVLLPSTSSRFVLFLTTLSVILIQHGINVLNDLIDWKKGADTEKELSWVHFHQLNLKTVSTHGLVSFFLGTFLGTLLVFINHRPEVFIVALPLLLLGYGYNASQWTLSYTNLGEWVTGLCYGPGVFGCMGYLLTGEMTKSLYLGSLAFAFLAVAVLLSHQPPQILNDFLAGKLSFAVRHGVKRTFFVAKVLFLNSLFLLTFIFCLNSNSAAASLLVSAGGILILIQQIKKQVSPQVILISSLALTLWMLSLKVFGGLL